MSKRLKFGLGAAIIVMFIAALYIFYILDPETNSLFPKCPFLLLTGFECPGCGSQRAIHQLMHLNLIAALRYNAFMVLVMPYIFLGVYLQYFEGKMRHPKLEKLFFGRWSALIVLILVISYWILRNVL